MDGPAATLLGLDTRIWQALVAGLVVAAGWLVNGWQNRRERRADRAEQLRDAHRAVYAEISAYLSNLVGDEALELHGRALVARMRDDPDFVPFVPRERSDRIFDALTDRIHVLPRVTIDPIVTYYSQIHAIEALADDMRGEAYKALSQDRRIDIYEDYIAMKRVALAYGRHALTLIEIYATQGKEAAEAARVSSRVSAPSGP